MRVGGWGESCETLSSGRDVAIEPVNSQQLWLPSYLHFEGGCVNENHPHYKWMFKFVGKEKRECFEALHFCFTRPE